MGGVYKNHFFCIYWCICKYKKMKNLIYIYIYILYIYIYIYICVCVCVCVNMNEIFNHSEDVFIFNFFYFSKYPKCDLVLQGNFQSWQFLPGRAEFIA